MRLLTLVLLTATLLFGQKTEIRGVLLEPGTNLPIEGAEIQLSVQQGGPVRINGGWKKDESRKILTGNTGAFTVTLDKPGEYRVEARFEGYIGMGMDGPRDYAEVTLTEKKPSADVKLFLARPGQVTGSVIDDDTRKPIPNVRLQAYRKFGGVGFIPETPTATDARGRFVAAGLTPGEYVMRILPQAPLAKRVLTSFTEEDIKKVDRDYEQTYWPGGHGEDMAMPVTVASGGTVDIGPIPARKVPYHRVHVRIPVSNCAEGDVMRVREHPVRPHIRGGYSLGKVPCGKDVLVTGVAPGRYHLIFEIEGRTAADRGTASVPISITDENIETAVSIVPGVAVAGTVVASEGARMPELSKIKIRLGADDGIGFPDAAPFVVPGSSGEFRISDLRPVLHRVFVSGLAPTHYVKEIRYNGNVLPDPLVPLDQDTMTRTLTIVVDDKPGTISGVVSSRGEPVSRPFIIAAKWPLPADKMNIGWGRARGDENGKYQMTGLAPGEYRVIALRSVEFGISNESLEQTLAAGKKVEVNPNGFQTVPLEPVEFRK